MCVKASVSSVRNSSFPTLSQRRNRIVPRGTLLKQHRAKKSIERCKSEPWLRINNNGVGVGVGVENKVDDLRRRRGDVTTTSLNVLFPPQTCSDLFFSPDYLNAPSPKSTQVYKKDAKVVVNVTVEGTPGPIRTMVKLGANVNEVIRLVLNKYKEEGRTPHLDDSSSFELYTSHFSLQSLSNSDVIGNVGSRSFHLRKSNSNNGIINSMELISLTDLEFDYINPYDTASRISKAVLPEFITQGILCFLFLITGHWVMSLYCILYLYYNVKLYMQRRHLIDVTEIFNMLNWEKKQRIFKLGHTIILLLFSLFMVIYSALENFDLD